MIDTFNLPRCLILNFRVKICQQQSCFIFDLVKWREKQRGLEKHKPKNFYGTMRPVEKILS